MNEGPGKNHIAMIKIDLEQVETMAAQGMNYTQIASALGISHDTLSSRREDQKGVQEAIDKGQAKGIALATGELLHGATGQKTLKPGQIRAIQYYLNNVAGWKNNPDQQITETNNYYIVGEAKAESAEAWVSQHKPTALPSQKEH